MKLVPIDQGVEYYHVHHCACGAEVFHDGAAAACENSYFENFQCADCKPYVYEELLTRGEVRPISRNLLETVCIMLVGWVCGLISCGAVWLVFR
jgi:hypothetical protein